MSPSSQIEGKRLDRRSAPQSPSEVPLWDVRERAARCRCVRLNRYVIQQYRNFSSIQPICGQVDVKATSPRVVAEDT